MKLKEKKVFLDSLSFEKRERPSFDLSLAKYVLKYKKNFQLYSAGWKKDFLGTHSKLYFSQSELNRLRQGERIVFTTGGLDSVTYKYYRPKYYYITTDYHFDFYDQIKERYANAFNYWKDWLTLSTRGISPVKMWNVSLVGSLIFGMFLMTMIYRYLGQGASAKNASLDLSISNQQELVLGESISMSDQKKIIEEAEDLTVALLEDYRVEAEKKKKEAEQSDIDKEYQDKILSMVKGYPIEKMIPEIVKKDKVVAAFLVGIARKESNWGKRVPVLNGQDCYNYWGYRGKRARMGTGGHTCFDSPEDAVNTVAKRIEFLVKNEKLNTPNKMVVVWKCGYDCSWDSEQAVRKWVSDVDMYFSKLNVD